MSKDKKLFNYFLNINIILTILLFIVFIASIIVSSISKNYSNTYAFLIVAPFCYLTNIVNSLVDKALFKNRPKKVVIILLYSIKGLILFISIIIALIVNTTTKTIIFDYSFLFITLFCFPMSILLSSVIIYNKK